MSEKIPSPKKRFERLEHTTLEGFTPLTEEAMRELPAAVIEELIRVGVADVASVPDNDHATDIRMRADGDGIVLVLGAVIHREDGHISGVLVQAESDNLVGRTTFTSDGNGENSLVYIGTTNTWMHKNEGMGEQRMRIINEYTKQEYNKPLSSISRSDSAQRVWDSLLERGLASRKTRADRVVVYSLL